MKYVQRQTSWSGSGFLHLCTWAASTALHARAAIVQISIAGRLIGDLFGCIMNGWYIIICVE
jgi:hypothetical protein